MLESIIAICMLGIIFVWGGLCACSELKESYKKGIQQKKQRKENKSIIEGKLKHLRNSVPEDARYSLPDEIKTKLENKNLREGYGISKNIDSVHLESPQKIYVGGGEGWVGNHLIEFMITIKTIYEFIQGHCFIYITIPKMYSIDSDEICDDRYITIALKTTQTVSISSLNYHRNKTTVLTERKGISTFEEIFKTIKEFEEIIKNK